ncbi:hypothetical protein Tco_0216390 [Tanacetum coccineum]
MVWLLFGVFQDLVILGIDIVLLLLVLHSFKYYVLGEMRVTTIEMKGLGPVWGCDTLKARNPVKGILLKLNLPDHRSRRRCSNLTPAESDSLPHAHAQATKTYYKHQDSRIKKAHELKTKTSTTLIFKIFLKDIKIIKTKTVKGNY